MLRVTPVLYTKGLPKKTFFTVLDFVPSILELDVGSFVFLKQADFILKFEKQWIFSADNSLGRPLSRKDAKFWKYSM